MIGKRNTPLDGSGRNAQEKAGTTGMPLLERGLPSEQDRKAVVGCLAAVLNIASASRRRLALADDGCDAAVAPRPPIPTAADAVVNPTSSSGAGDNCRRDDTDAADSDAPATTAAFSIRDHEGRDEVPPSQTNDSRFGRSTTVAKSQQRQQLRAARREGSFQRSLLDVSAEMLFLSPDHALAFVPNLDIRCEDESAERELLLAPFLGSLSSEEESFRCIALLTFRFLLMSGGGEGTPTERGGKVVGGGGVAKMTIVGYDARVRFALKSLAVSILSHWELEHRGGFMTAQSAASFATRKFEALEDGIALRLSVLSRILMQREREERGKVGGGMTALSGRKKQNTFGQNALRGLKIGAAGVAAGTVFAITGGLAAPAIVGGIAALAGVSSAVSIVATVLLLPAATTIFGVGGGTLVASKMSKRTAGLEDFDIERVPTCSVGDGAGARGDKEKAGGGEENVDDDDDDPVLSRTLCVSGWLRDVHDFERPFGVSPRGLTDRHELLCRYCSVYAPNVVPDCGAILKEWRGRENELWDALGASYGKDPSSLYPFGSGPRFDALLTEREDAGVDDLMRAMGLPYPTGKNDSRQSAKREEPSKLPPVVNLLSDVLAPNNDDSSSGSIKKSKKQTAPTSTDAAMQRSYEAWDFHSEYGSEQYIVRWEKDLLMELHGSSKEFQKDLAKKAATEALKQTAMKSLLAAVALPGVLLSLSNIIDEKWTLVAERSDEAGILLAQSLLDSNAGHRPVSLIGFSFGARMIVACLKELARNQAIWERQQEENDTEEINTGNQTKAATLRKSISSISMRQQGARVDFSREPASIVEDVVLMGCPASVNKSAWLSCREVVGGRLINCFSQRDMILALMYRAKNIASSLLSPPVGIGNVNVSGVENYDVSRFVASHGEYCVAAREILNLVGYGQPMKVKTMQTCGAS